MRKVFLLTGLMITTMLAASCDKFDMFNKGHRHISCTVDVSGTKSVPITTSSIQGFGFVMEAYADEAYHDNETNEDFSAGKYFTETVTYSSSDGWTISNDPVWLNGVNLRFFCWSPLDSGLKGSRSISTADVKSDVLNFSYTANSGYTSATTEDLIFSYNAQTVEYDDKGEKTSGDEEISIKFYHALSQIRFCLSTDDATYDKSLKLVSVKFKSEPVGGTCAFKGTGTVDANTMFTWTPSSTPAAFTQTFNSEFGKLDSSSNEIVPTNWVKGSYSKNSTTYNLYTCTGDVIFLVPQKNFTNKKIEVTFQKGSADPYTMTATLPDGTWVAGKYYTYKIKALKTLSLTLLSSDWIDGSEDLEF